jgi:hypothetical protein
MFDVRGMVGIVMKGGGKLAKGDMNLFSLRKPALVEPKNLSYYDLAM